MWYELKIKSAATSSLYNGDIDTSINSGTKDNELR